MNFISFKYIIFARIVTACVPDSFVRYCTVLNNSLRSCTRTGTGTVRFSGATGRKPDRPATDRIRSFNRCSDQAVMTTWREGHSTTLSKRNNFGAGHCETKPDFLHPLIFISGPAYAPLNFDKSSTHEDSLYHRSAFCRRARPPSSRNNGQSTTPIPRLQGDARR